MGSKLAFSLVLIFWGLVISSPLFASVSGLDERACKIGSGLYENNFPFPLAKWRLPVKTTVPVTSCYGARHLLNKFYDFHYGVDFGARAKTPVSAVASGKVIWLGSMGCAGRGIVIEHKLKSGDTVFSLYKHLKKYLVISGQHVDAGQRIGLSGASGKKLDMSQAPSKRGCVLGPHLHLEFKLVRKPWTTRDVELTLKKTKGHLSDTVVGVDPSRFIPPLKDHCS